MEQDKLIEEYGSRLAMQNGALFVGAGVSMGAGYPSWLELVAPLKSALELPSDFGIATLIAEYFSEGIAGGRARLEQHLRDSFGVDRPLTPSHRHIAALGLSELWTTNYDRMLERADPSATVVVDDTQLADRRLRKPRIVKMHGSITFSEEGVRWATPPVITRKDYESYQDTHPRLWANLVSNFLTKSFLFLGFSFSDPNIEVLLALARTRLRLGGPEHFAVLKHSDDPLHRHQVADLERSGVAVTEVADYGEIEDLLRRLVLRTQPLRLFISGSDTDGVLSPYCENIGARLAELDISLTSAAGAAGVALAYSFADTLSALSKHDPDRLRFYFRLNTRDPPIMARRLGTVVYTSYPTKEQLIPELLRSTRALLLIAGGSGSAREADVAVENRIPVIPVGASGGAAGRLWEKLRGQVGALRYGGKPVQATEFEALASHSPAIASGAALRLCRQAMYLDSSG